MPESMRRHTHTLGRRKDKSCWTHELQLTVMYGEGELLTGDFEGYTCLVQMLGGFGCGR